MSETEKIEILLRAKDRDLTRALERSNKMLARFEREASKASTSSARNIERDMQDMGRSVDGFSTKLNGAIGGLLGSLAAGGLTAAIAGLRGVVNGVARIGDEARRAGVNVQAFQELSYVATATRIPIDALVDGLKELNLRGDEFATTGAGSAAEAFARLGYSAAQVKAALAQPDQMMLQIIGRMEQLDKAAQIRIADEIFGGAGGERFVELMAQGESGMRQMITEAHTLGAVLDREAIAKAQELDRRFQDLTVRVETFFQRAAVAAADFGASAIDEFAEGVESATNARAALAEDVAQAGLRDRASALLGEPETVAALGREADYLRHVLERMATIDEERLIAAEGIASAYRLISAEGRNVVLQLQDAAESAAYYADTASDDAMAAQLAQSAAALTQLIEGFASGVVSADEFNLRMAVLIGEADAARIALADLDGVNFDRLRAGIGGILGQLAAVITSATAAGRAMQSLPSAATMAGRRNAQEGRLGDIAVAPTPQSPGRPQSRPNDIDFGVIEPPAARRGGGGGSAAKPYGDTIKSLREEIAQLGFETAAILEVAGSNQALGDALAYARTQAELLAAAQAEGREITPELREEIAQLAGELDAAATAADEAAAGLDRMKDAGARGAEALADVFTSVLDGSKSAKDAVGDLLMQMAKIQIQQAFLGAFGGTSFGQAVGLGLSGARAAGGGVAAGGAYLVNENTPRSEVFVPSQSGAVLNVPQAQAALRQSASEGGGRTLVEVVASPLLEARIREIAEGVSSRHARAAMASVPGQITSHQTNPRRGR